MSEYLTDLNDNKHVIFCREEVLKGDKMLGPVRYSIRRQNGTLGNNCRSLRRDSLPRLELWLSISRGIVAPQLH